MPSRKKRNELEKAKIYFPWVADRWTSLEEEQKRQKNRLQSLSPSVASSTNSILKKICTFYGTAPGTTCQICQVVHVKRKKGLLELKNEDEHTGGYSTRASIQLKASRKRQTKLLQREMESKQIKRMQYAVQALKQRRRTREKKMGVDKDSFLQDFTDTGGSTITKEMNAAIDSSFQNQGMSRKEKRFKGRIKTKSLKKNDTRNDFLRFPDIASSIGNDHFDEDEEDLRVVKLDTDKLLRKKKKLRKKAEKWRRDREGSSGRNARRKKKVKEEVKEENGIKKGFCGSKLKWVQSMFSLRKE